MFDPLALVVKFIVSITIASLSAILLASLKLSMKSSPNSSEKFLPALFSFTDNVSKNDRAESVSEAY